MKNLSFVCLGVVVTALLSAALWGADAPKKKADLPAGLAGTWEQVIAQTGNQIIPADAAKNGTVKTLHMTATHFTRVAYLSKSKQILGIVGGQISILNGNYVENIEYADEAARKAADGQKPMEFKIELKNDLLTLKQVGANPEYSEVWKRSQ